MTLWEMSIYAAVLIIAILVIRAVAVNKLPKKTFLVLWGIVVIRLLIPFTVTSQLSVYTLANHIQQRSANFQVFGSHEPDAAESDFESSAAASSAGNDLESSDAASSAENDFPILGETVTNNSVYTPESAIMENQAIMENTAVSTMDNGNPTVDFNSNTSDTNDNAASSTNVVNAASAAPSEKDISMENAVVQETPPPIRIQSVLLILWLAGVLISALIFMVPHIRCRLEYRTAVPVGSEFPNFMIQTGFIRRKVRIKQYDQIKTPFTYGILKPVILLPKEMVNLGNDQLRYVLIHEYIHIRHFDAVLKYIFAFAACIHWFNPLVWVMYLLANRDIELSCDESVVRSFGESLKSDYARTLISLEESKSRLNPLCSHFCKNAVEERIKAIMKIKKTSLAGSAVALVLTASIAITFTTSAAEAPTETALASEASNQNFQSATAAERSLNDSTSDTAADSSSGSKAGSEVETTADSSAAAKIDFTNMSEADIEKLMSGIKAEYDAARKDIESNYTDLEKQLSDSLVKLKKLAETETDYLDPTFLEQWYKFTDEVYANYNQYMEQCASSYEKVNEKYEDTMDSYWDQVSEQYAKVTASYSAKLEKLYQESMTNETNDYDSSIDGYEAKIDELQKELDAANQKYDSFTKVLESSNKILDDYYTKANAKITEFDKIADPIFEKISTARQKDYSKYGLTRDKKTGRYYYNDKLVRYFEDRISSKDDNQTYGPCFSTSEGVIDVFALRDKDGNLTGFETFAPEHTKDYVKKWFNHS